MRGQPAGDHELSGGLLAGGSIVAVPPSRSGTRSTTIEPARSQRSLGAFYTPDSSASFLANWALRTHGDTVLEPSFGDGSFLRALRITAEARQLSAVKIFGCELAGEPFARAVTGGLLDPTSGFLSDFLALAPFQVDAVIGNPPYVRLRALPLEQRGTAMSASQEVLARPMDPSGSLWMPFVLHATRFLRKGGRLGLVLPFELTHVRYGRSLWDFLARRFRSLRIIRVHERIFPELLQEVVLLFADDFGASTEQVEFEAYEHVTDLLVGRPSHQAKVSIEAVVKGHRRFNLALLPGQLVELLEGKLSKAVVPARDIVRFNIGYVSADKRFFHPSPEQVDEFALPPTSLLPTFISSRSLRGCGLWSSRAPDRSTSRLFLPPVEASALQPQERRYIEMGVQLRVPDRYKCRNRHPWYVVPDVRRPDVLVSVFSENPILLVNDGQFTASNSFLCGHVFGTTPTALAAQWYTSLTLLGTELEVHSLGGGVMVLVPREAGNVKLTNPSLLQDRACDLAAIDKNLRRGDTLSAYTIGDEATLRRGLGLSEDEIDLIWRGVAALRHWRGSRPRGASLEEI